MNPKLLGSLLVGIIVLTGVYIGSLSLNQKPITDNILTDQQAQVSSSGLSSHWKFDEGSGSKVSSSVGNKSDTLGSPSWITGKVGGALSFNGSDYVNAGGLTSSKVSISVWINPTIRTEWGSVVMKPYSLGIETQGSNVYANIGNGSAWSPDAGGHLQAPISGGTWQHVVQTFDGTTNKLYINGSLVASGAASLSNSSSDPILIGSWNTDFDEPFMGGIDDVRIYSRALSESEVAELAGITVTPPAPSAPTATLSANPTSIVSGSATTLTWSSTNATSCTATGGTFAGTKAVSGSAAVSPTANTTYGISCTGAGGTTAATPVAVNVTAPVDATAPVISGVSASSITTTGAAISYSTNEASDTYVEYGLTTSYGSNTTLKDIGSAMKTSHSETLSGLAAGTVYNYRVTSKDATGNKAVSGNYTFTTAPSAPTATLSANPTSIVSGSATTLTWSSTNATSCTATGGTFAGTKAVSGSAAVSPTANTTYGISCTGAGGTTAATPVAVNVTAAPATNPLTAQWKFDETSGTSATDSSGNARTATLVGGVTRTTGVSGNGLSFNGTSGYVNAGNIQPKGFTLSAWVNMTASTQTGDKSIAMKPYSYGLEVQNGQIYSRIGNGTNSWTSSASAPLTSGVWHHVAQVYNGSSNILYLDGKQVATNAATLTNNSANLLIGSWNGSTEFFNGKIDEVALHSSALSDNQILNLYRSIVPPTGTPTTYSVSVTKSGTGSGTVTSTGSINCGVSCSSTGDAGQSVTLTATPATGSTFSGWSGGTCSGTSATCTFTLTSNKTVTASFTGIPTTYSVTVTKAGTGSGTVTSTGSINCGTSCTANGTPGQTVTLTATPATGSTFAGWSGACTGTSTTCSFTLNSNTSANATFNLAPVNPTTFTITTAKAGTGSGTVTCNPSTCTANTGSAVSVTATPASGSTFVGWSGACTGTGACSLTSAGTVTATFNTIPQTGGTTINVTPSTWTNLTFQRGYTYILAPGTYAAKTLSTPVSGTSPITIKKGSESGQVVFNGTFDITSSYWIFDGVTGGGPTAWTSGHGFRFNAGTAFYANTAVGNITIEHSEFVGPGLDGACSQNIEFRVFSGSVPNITLRNNYHRNMSSSVLWINGATNLLWEDNYVADSPSTDACHGEAIYMTGSSNATFRNSMWRNVDGTGVIMVSGDGFKIYGNTIWWDSTNGGTGNGAIGGWSHDNTPTRNAQVYNNTIINGKGFNNGIAFHSANVSGNIVRNNLMVGNGTAYISGAATVSNNIIDNDTSRFVDYTGRNLRLKAALPGAALSTEFNKDIVGATRGSDGVWDIGAYEYTGTVTNPNSTKFQANDRIVTTDVVNVRSSASQSSTLAGTQALGVSGTVIGGGTYNSTDGYYWWNINYDNGVDGWSVENYLSKYTAPATYTITTAKAGTGSGTVACNPTSCTANTGSGVTVTATPASGSTFVGWSGACTGTGACSLTAAGTVTATFNTNPVTGGTTVHVKPTATGNGSGSDWNNAMAWSSATFVRGNTYYLADGSYVGKSFSTPVDGTKLITIKKATAADHGSNTGWVSTDGDGQAVFTQRFIFETSNYVINGQVRNENNWFDAASYGFSIGSPTAENQIRIGNYGKAPDNITIMYTYVPGWSAPLPTVLKRIYAIDVDDYDGGTTSEGLVFSRMYVSGSNNVWFLRTTNGAIVEYSASDGSMSNGENHGEIVNLYFSGENAIVRYNQWRNAFVGSTGTALVAITQADGLQFYGNLAYNFNTGDGAVGYGYIDTRPTYISNNNRVYNNTFANCNNTGSYSGGIALTGANNIVRNNLWINCKGGITDSHDYSGFSDANARGEANAQINIPTSIFTNYAANNFTLSTNTTAGDSTVPTQYRTDMFGRTGLSRGALQYSGTTQPPVNVAPSVTLISSPASAVTPATFTLTASASDSDGTVSKVEFYNGSTLLSTDTLSPYSYAWAQNLVGNYSLTAKAYDNAGAVTTSNSVSAAVTAVVIPNSTKFSANDRVVTTDVLNVRSGALQTATLLGAQPLAALGTIIGGGISADGYYWWNINYDTGFDGWSVENYLSKYTAPATYSFSVTSSAGGSVTCGGTACPSTVTAGTQVTLIAAASANYNFNGWGGACASASTANTCVVTVNSNTSVSAAFISTTVVSSGNWYIRSGATGNGSSWTNAWGSPASVNWASVQPGDTIWIAGGTYSSGFSMEKSGTASKPIYIKRVLSSDTAPTSAAGWTSSYDSQVKINGNGFWFGTAGGGSYINVDGRVAKGISVKYSDSDWSSSAIFFYAGGAHDITFSNMDLAGPGGSSPYNYINDTSVISVRVNNGGGAIYNFTMNDSELHGGPNLVYNLGANYNFLFNRVKFYDAASSGDIHDNMVYTNGGYYNWSFANCDFSNWQVEGINMYQQTNNPLYVYGSVFHHPMPGARAFWLANESGSPTGPLYLYNNTFSGVNVTYPESRASMATASSKSRNNIFHNSSFASGSSITDSSNNFVTSDGSIFVSTSATSPNYRLKAPLSGAVALTGNPVGGPAAGTAPYNVDRDGKVRGSDGTWDVGAYEFTQ